MAFKSSSEREKERIPVAFVPTYFAFQAVVMKNYQGRTEGPNFTPPNYRRRAKGRRLGRRERHPSLAHNRLADDLSALSLRSLRKCAANSGYVLVCEESSAGDA